MKPQLPKLILFLCLLVFAIPYSIAQKVQWASEVVGVSTEYKLKGKINTQYKATQALGEPNKLPAIGNSSCAWSPASPSSSFPEWIHVRFAEAQAVKQVLVAETYNPGAVSKIMFIDEGNGYHVVYTKDEFKNSKTKGGLYSYMLPELTDYKVKEVKVLLSTSKVKGFNHIDAIGISDSEVKPKIVVYEGKELMEFKVEKVKGALNTSFDEINPVISPDGNRLYFVRRGHPKNYGDKKMDDIWYVDRKGNYWGTPKLLSPPINNTGNNYVCAIDLNGNMLLGNVYLENGEMAKGLSIANENSDRLPVPLEIPDFQNNSNIGDFYLATNNRVMIMSIQQTDYSFGERDLYVSFRGEGGKWSAPLNLGSSINTASHEMTPFLAPDGETLYFSSTGYSGYGQADIYMSKRLDETWENWSKPVNLGKKVNNEGSQVSFCMDAKGKQGFYVSLDTEGKGADIYTFNVPKNLAPKKVVEVRGRIYDAETNENIFAQVMYQNREGKTEGFFTPNLKTGEFKVILPASQSFTFKSDVKGYYLSEQKVELSGESSYAQIDLVLHPLKIGQRINLKDLIFVQSKAEVMYESVTELQRLLAVLEGNPTLKILLEGHTDLDGDPEINLALSEQRVQTVKKYLKDNGIEENRIQTQAFGSTKPLTQKRDYKSKKMNRRVEFKVLEI
ncbi:OmpA family protein [Sediminitomix flava]|nr:OmpA family protein [Sediminitomix flava]